MFIKPINISNNNLEKLFSNIILVWTGVSRNSSKVVEDYKFKSKNTKQNLDKIKEYVEPFKSNLENNKLNFKYISSLIENSWNFKKGISKKISNKKLEKFSLKLHKIGVNGHRLIGAGGGGFFVFSKFNSAKKIKKLFPKAIKMNVKYEPLGSRPVSVLYN